MRERRHAGHGPLDWLFVHAGVWIPLWLLVALVVSLFLGGPSPRY